MLAKPSLTLKRKIKASPAKVYEAWTDPQKLTQWFGPAETISGSVQAELDIRVGGAFRISFKTSDGEYHEVGGIYRDVAPNHRLVFSWAWHTMKERESLVTISIAEDGDGAMLTLHHEQFADEAARDGHQRGWTGTLDKLEALFA